MDTVQKRLTAELVARFCAAIQYAKREHDPSAQERRALALVLADIARWAHRSRVAPEHVLIELKSNWTRVCQREPSPDMNDPLWGVVVKLALDAYERARVEAA